MVMMIPNLTSLLLIISVPFLFLVIQLWNKTKSPGGKYKNLPPSPRPRLPIIGHLHHLVGGLPHEALDRVTKKFGPILHLQLGEVSTIVISSRQAAKEVLKTHDPACADRPESVGTKTMWYNNTDIAFSPYNEYWRQMRKICIVELLSAKNVRSFGSIRQDEMCRLVESFRSLPPGEAVDLTDKIFTYSSTITCRAAFGEVLRDRDTLIALMKKASAMAGGLELADLFPSFKLLQLFSFNKYKLLSMRSKLDAILSVFVEEHRLKPPTSDHEDILDVLLRMQRNRELEFPITNDNIKAVIFDMFSGGTETSSTTIDWVMVELIKNPHVMEKVQTEIREAFKGKTSIEERDISALKYLKLVIKESLRLHPPFPLLPRACREECKVNGYDIPLKSKIMVNVWSMGRDPEYWPEPESFKPERFESNSKDFLGSNFEFLPFGAGRRFCPGMNFGLATVELSLAQLLYHFDWKMPQGMSPDDIDLTEAEGIAVSRKNGLFLVPTPV